MARFDPATAPLRAIALYGGTFDPIHLGHLRVSTEARRAFGFTVIRLLPAAQPALRDTPGASAAQRLAMVRLAAGTRPGFEVDDRELARAGPSYTIDSLRAIRAEVGERQPLAWLLGADALASIDQWHEYTSLLSFAHVVVLDRPAPSGSGPERAYSPAVQSWIDAHRCDDRSRVHAEPAGRLLFFNGPRIDISATDVRARCAAGQSVTAMLPAEVWAYIRKEHLYGVADAAP